VRTFFRRYCFLVMEAILMCGTHALAASYKAQYAYQSGTPVEGAFVYPYVLQFVDANGNRLAPISAGIPPGTPASLRGICDDFTATVAPGETWLANVSTLPDLATNSADLAQTPLETSRMPCKITKQPFGSRRKRLIARPPGTVRRTITVPEVSHGSAPCDSKRFDRSPVPRRGIL
jgi:hypothetical protein